MEPLAPSCGAAESLGSMRVSHDERMRFGAISGIAAPAAFPLNWTTRLDRYGGLVANTAELAVLPGQ